MKIITCFLLTALIGTAQADPSKLQQDLLRTAKELGHEEFTEREAALEKMQKLVEGKKKEALPLLRDLWHQKKAPEIKNRIYGIARDLYLKKKNAFFGFRFEVGKQLTLEGRECLSIKITETVKGMPAQGAGLNGGDLLLGVGDELLDPKSNLDDILKFFRKQPLGKELNLRVRRKDKDMIIPMQPGEQDLTPEELMLLKQEFRDWFLQKPSKKAA